MTEPMRILQERLVSSTNSSDMAHMSRRRFFCFQTVTLLTALITGFTFIAVALLKNDEMQDKLQNLGTTATCLLNVTAHEQKINPEQPAPTNWNDFLALILKLSNTCVLANDVDDAES